MSWSEERVELLKKLWAQGLSASQIATELDGGVTRNAVIGKVHRLGLSGRAKSPSAQAPRPRKAAAKEPGHAAAHAPMVLGNLAVSPRPMPLPLPLAVPAAEPEVDVVIPITVRVTLMDLRESMCRWPLGDPTSPEFRFCGSKSPSGIPYCAQHARIAYQPSTDRRRDRRPASIP